MPFALDPNIGRVLEIEAKGVRHTIGCTVDHIRQEPVIEHLTEPGTEVGRRERGRGRQ